MLIDKTIECLAFLANLVVEAKLPSLLLIDKDRIQWGLGKERHIRRPGGMCNGNDLVCGAVYGMIACLVLRNPDSIPDGLCPV